MAYSSLVSLPPLNRLLLTLLLKLSNQPNWHTQDRVFISVSSLLEWDLVKLNQRAGDDFHVMPGYSWLNLSHLHHPGKSSFIDILHQVSSNLKTLINISKILLTSLCKVVKCAYTEPKQLGNVVLSRVRYFLKSYFQRLRMTKSLFHCISCMVLKEICVQCVSVLSFHCYFIVSF